MAKVTKGKWLSCGCCGDDFQTWEGYEDQDQDSGYGICQPCQLDAIKRFDQDMDVAAKIMEQSLNTDNRVKFMAMSPDERRTLAAQAIQDGILKISFIRIEDR